MTELASVNVSLYTRREWIRATRAHRARPRKRAREGPRAQVGTAARRASSPRRGTGFATGGGSDADRSGETGNRTTNVAPFPTPSLRASMLPPCSSTRCLTIARPSPSPPCARVTVASCCLKGWKTCGQEGWRDPSTCVRHDDFDVRVFPLHSDVNAAALRREFDRVRQQIPDDLLKTPRVAVQRPRIGIKEHLKPHVLRVRGRPNDVDRRLDDFCRLERRQGKSQLPGNDTVEVEQVFDELNLNLDVALDGLERALSLLLAEMTRAKHSNPSEDGAQRRSQLVRRDAQQLIFRAARFLGTAPLMLRHLEEPRIVDRGSHAAAQLLGDVQVSLLEEPS